MRLDVYLVESGSFESRNQAQAAIREGHVLVNHKQVKASYDVQEEDQITIESPSHDVSRSAKKLREATRHFNLSFTYKTVLDLGQGSGGFTQVCLEEGARQVIGLDVGHSQLHESLRTDSRVRVIEGVNIKQIATLELPPIDLVVCDLSFISSLSVLPFITHTGDEFVLLLKPQFESFGKHLKNGVITDSKVLEEITDRATKTITSYGFCVQGIQACETKGKTGNQEYIMWFRRC